MQEQVTISQNHPGSDENAPKTSCFFRYLPSIFTAAVAVFMTVQTILMVIQESPKCYYYLTNWGHWLVNFYFVIAAIISFQAEDARKKWEGRRLTVLHVAGSMQFLIFLFYWSVLSYDSIKKIIQLPTEAEQKNKLF